MSRSLLRGQAMTEFLVACLVLIPLFLAIPLLGKYMDISHSTTQATRYLAWERTVWTTDRKSSDQLQNEMRNRIYTRPGTRVNSTDGAQPPAAFNPLWKDVGGKPMLASFGDVTGGNPEGGKGETSPGLIYNNVVSTLVSTYDTVMRWMQAIGGVHRDGFKINIAGVYSGMTGVAVAEQGDNGGRGLLITPLHIPKVNFALRPNVIITDAWAVSGPGSGNHCSASQDQMSELCQVAPLVPTTVLSGWFNTLTHDVGVVIPEFKSLDYGYIVPGVVPADRQKP